MQAPLNAEQTKRRDELAGRLFGACSGALDLVAIYIGHHLGYYRALTEHGPATSAQLAKRTGTHERYAREWLEQQAVSGLLHVDDPRKDAAQRTFSIDAGTADVVLNPLGPCNFVPGIRCYIAGVAQLPAILDAYRTGGGVSWAEMSAEVVEGQAGFNQAVFTNLFTQQDIPAIPDVHKRLQADPPARVADVGCGAGWSAIALAKAYPKVRVDGFDFDPRVIALGKQNAAEAGVADRVAFEVRDVASLPARTYDVITLLECLHDLPHPVATLSAARKALAPGGAVVVMEERVGEAFTVPGQEFDQFCYGWSIMLCLPGGMYDKGSAGTGTVLRAPTLRRYAQEAGFADVEVLPIDTDPLRRWYRLRA
ncbi:MAG TPA: class I SAM-dependent methyltransferase [Candidatus Thermoplasmatota archaeon]|nr:class I SAM-dependent methyltransferase [Candidatus Thermoplasmatota archaeon]